LKIAFLGTSAFAGPALRALAETHEIGLVVTQPDRPAGRHAKLHASPIKTLAIELGLPLAQPQRINNPDGLEALHACAPEAIVVASYGQLLKAEVFDLPPLGTINIHASLLPAYRGAAPVNWALIHGETQTGVATFFIEKGLDTGDVLLMRALDIGPDEDASALEVRLADLGAALIVETLEGLADGSLHAVPQPEEGVSLAPSLTRDNGRIDWTQPAQTIHNLVRGTVPWPGAWSHLGKRRVKIHKTRLLDSAAGPIGPGEIGLPETNRLIVGTSDGLLEILEIQREGKPAVCGADFLHGVHLPARFS